MDRVRQFLKDRAEAEGLEVKQIYTKPPANTGMVYPCIVIKRDTGNTKFADNIPFRHSPRFQLTAIYSEADSPLYKFLALLPRCVHNRSFPADNLNHDVFTMFFEEEE